MLNKSRVFSYKAIKSLGVETYQICIITYMELPITSTVNF